MTNGPDQMEAIGRAVNEGSTLSDSDYRALQSAANVAGSPFDNYGPRHKRLLDKYNKAHGKYK